MSDKYLDEENDFLKWMHQNSMEKKDDMEEFIGEDYQKSYNEKEFLYHPEEVYEEKFEEKANLDEDNQFFQDEKYFDYSSKNNTLGNTQKHKFEGFKEFMENKNTRGNDEKYEYINKYIDSKISKVNKRWRFLRVFALVLAGSLMGSFLTMYGMQPSNEKFSKTPTESISINASQEANIENVVAIKATPSVVAITVKYRESRGFFGGIVEGEAIGSGVITSEDGYIITNAHVVNNKPEDIKVLFHNNEKANAVIVWKDETLDLAIIKADAKNLVPIEFADSDNVRVGDKAIAIGNPVGLNLQSTLTSGYISGLNRTIRLEDGNIMDGLFQTDASINSGNSGGALLNKNGQLIGINTAKVKSTDGIGFAIPVNITKGIVNGIIEKGSFKQVQIGIRGINLDVYKQHSLDKIEQDEGVYVTDVVEGSAASNSNLKSGDIIIGIGEKKVESMNKLKQLLLSYKVGDSAVLKVIRGGKELKIDITFLGAAPNL